MNTHTATDEVMIYMGLGSHNTVIETEGTRMIKATEITVHYGRVFSSENRVISPSRSEIRSMSRRVQPMRHGIIAEFDEMKALLSHFVLECENLWPPERAELSKKAMVTVPLGITPVEQDLITESLKLARVHDVIFVQNLEAVLAGSMFFNSEDDNGILIDFGGSTTEIATVSNKKIISSHSIRVGGECFDNEIEQYLRSHHVLRVGNETIERLRNIGVADLGTTPSDILVKGRDIVSGLPRDILVNPLRIQEELKRVLEKIAVTVEQMVLKPKKIVITGGASQLAGLSDWFERRLNAPVFIEDRPLETAIDGLKQL